MMWQIAALGGCSIVAPSINLQRVSFKNADSVGNVDLLRPFGMPKAEVTLVIRSVIHQPRPAAKRWTNDK